VKLNLGAGNVRLRAGYRSVDSNSRLNPDILARVPPIPVADASCEALFAGHFLEHLPKDVASELLREAYRVLVPGGEFEIVVPFALSREAHQDPTHVSFWVPESFVYYTKVFSYLGYDLEDRFELVVSELHGSEVHAVLRKPRAS
jgi:predicted SAM-dependent methyltransferase